MAKKDNTPAISFFSFQDIITSITGIMFLVVLILVLLVVTRSKTAVAAGKVDLEIAELRQKIEQLKTAVAESASRRDTLRQRISELEKLDAASLPAKREELLRQLIPTFRSPEEVNRSVAATTV